MIPLTPVALIFGNPACADIPQSMAKQHLAALVAALSIVSAACGLIAASRAPDPGPSRPRAFVTTFDRVLVAGFFAGKVPDGRRDIDLNEETSRLLRMALRSRVSVNLVDSPPVHLPEPNGTSADPEETGFQDVAFWKRLGEEYRQPLILTGTVAFRRAGSQSVERQIGPRAVTVWRPRFKLELRVVFICGRTGQILESLSLGPEMKQASDERTSALALYLQLMDRLTPEVLAVFGARGATSHPPR
jgi:hypothetical protein